MTLDTSYHKRTVDTLKADPAFRPEYERSRAAIEQIDEIVRQLDERRKQLGLTKAELARMIGKNPAHVRRLFTAGGNPEIQTITALTVAMGGRLQPSFKGTSKRRLVPTG